MPQGRFLGDQFRRPLLNGFLPVLGQFGHIILQANWHEPSLLAALQMSPERLIGDCRALFNGAQPPRPLLSDFHGVLNGLVE